MEDFLERVKTFLVKLPEPLAAFLAVFTLLFVAALVGSLLCWSTVLAVGAGKTLLGIISGVVTGSWIIACCAALIVFMDS